MCRKPYTRSALVLAIYLCAVPLLLHRGPPSQAAPNTSPALTQLFDEQQSAFTPLDASPPRSGKPGAAPFFATDGTTALPSITRLPAPGMACAASIDGRVYFRADDGVHGAEPWVSDGTPSGTHLLADLAPGEAASMACDFVAFGGTVVFFAAERLWRTDGTPEGTLKLTNALYPDGLAADAGLTVVGALGFFAQREYLRVLESDLQTVHDVGTFDLAGKFLMPLWPRFAVGDRLVFRANPYMESRQLWSSDGTPAGTYLLAQPVERLAATSDHVIFFKNTDLWVTDGTAEHTLVLTQALELEPANSLFFSSANGTRAFFGESATDRSWIAVSDGTPGGTRVLRRFAEKYSALVATDTGAYLVLAVPGPSTSQFELRFLDGEDGTTRLLRAFPSSSEQDNLPQELALLNGRLFFTANDPEHGRELWVSDGSAVGTRLCVELNPGPGSSSPYLAGAAGRTEQHLLVVADDGVHERGLWALPLATLCASKLYLPQIGERRAAGV